ncbi:MAG: AAA family ATPase [Candidatus Sumerlaeota bacterium]|nr:AAA family ATPase [Candidatus Sumerlaeota bacterium]
MIVEISISNFKAIRYLDLRLDDFHILAGPNASGKTTFLEAIDFVKDCLRIGPRNAVELRVPDFDDLTYMREGGEIIIAFWLYLPEINSKYSKGVIGYFLAIGKDEQLGVHITTETLTAFHEDKISSYKKRVGEDLVKKSKKAYYYQREDGAYKDSFVFGMDKLALSLTPPDEKRYPTANAVKRFLMDNIRYIQLNSRAMRLPCPVTQGIKLELDGSNLARVVGWLIGTTKGKKELASKSRNNAGKIASRVVNGKKTSVSGSASSDVIERWTDHLRYALPDLKEIAWNKREADNAEYITLKYANGLECPSWLLSDGTLRMLALTLPAFLAPSPGIYMVEEPENGVHPKALEIILRSLSTIPDSQTFVATHSPLVIQQMGKDSLLCFSKDEFGVHVIPGKDHPFLKDWDGTPDLATIFAAGVLG